MNSRNAYALGLRLKDITERNDQILTYLYDIGAKHQDYLTLPNLLLGIPMNNEMGSKVKQLQQSIRLQGDATLARIRNMPPYDFVPKAAELTADLQALREISGNSTLEELLSKEMKLLPVEHTHAYSERDFNRIFGFVLLCKSVRDKLSLLTYLFDSFIQLGGEPQPHTEDLGEMELFIDQDDNSVLGLAILLMSIQTLYTTISKIYGGDIVPLQYIKVETGSKWLKFFGRKEVLVLITVLLTEVGSTVRDLSKNQVPPETAVQRMQTATGLLDLLEKGKKAGLKEEDMDLIRKAFQASVLQMSAGSREITVDKFNILKEKETTPETKRLTNNAKETLGLP